MDALNLIFYSFFQVVPFDLFGVILGSVFIFELVLTLTQNWEII